ncbi:hypothetical protein FOTG_18948, partial [Fusarium oxysporum f. sp. vasinfectum 25433]
YTECDVVSLSIGPDEEKQYKETPKKLLDRERFGTAY